jgi:serine/threonine protein kinase
VSELLDALDCSLKHGVVHRDIKPSNMILLVDGTVKVADFGIARIESSTLTQVGTVMGSPSYMPPEQFLAQTVDGRSDLYSAGVVFYELLTGEAPFTGPLANIMQDLFCLERRSCGRYTHRLQSGARDCRDAQPARVGAAGGTHERAASAYRGCGSRSE